MAAGALRAAGAGAGAVPGAGRVPGAGTGSGSEAGVSGAGPAAYGSGSEASESSGASKKGRRYRAPESRKRLTFSQQREYDTIEDVIDELTARSKKLEEEMAGVTSDYVKLQALSEEKQKVDEELEEKIERFIELQEMVESFGAT